MTMRIKELANVRHRPRIQQFVKTNLEARIKTELKTDRSSSRTPVPVGKPATIEEPVKKQLPLFMEPVFKAKDFDPL